MANLDGSSGFCAILFRLTRAFDDPWQAHSAPRIFRLAGKTRRLAKSSAQNL